MNFEPQDTIFEFVHYAKLRNCNTSFWQSWLNAWEVQKRLNVEAVSAHVNIYC